MRKCTLLHSRVDLHHVMFPMSTRQVPQGLVSVVNSSRGVDPSTLALCTARSHAQLEVIAALPAFLVPGSFTMLEAKTADAGHVSHPRTHAGMECRLVDGRSQRQHRVSNGTECLAKQDQRMCRMTMSAQVANGRRRVRFVVHPETRFTGPARRHRPGRSRT